MKKSIFILILGFTFLFGNAQRVTNPPSANRVNDGLISSDNRYGSIAGKGEISYEDAIAEYKNIKGSPFLHGGEITVDLIYYNDSIFSNIDILYDIYNQEIIAKTKNGNTVVLDQLYYKGFIYNNDGTKETYMRVHPLELDFFKVLFQNEDFIFCQKIKTSVSDDTRYIPGQEKKKSKFVQTKSYYIIQDKLANTSNLRNDAMVKYLPWKYRSQVHSLKKKLRIKKLNKEKEYLLIMDKFEKSDATDGPTN